MLNQCICSHLKVRGELKRTQSRPPGPGLVGGKADLVYWCNLLLILVYWYDRYGLLV